MINLITFSDQNMTRSADLCMTSAQAHGVDEVRCYSPEYLSDWETVKAYPEIFRQPEDPRRAWGWWAFKPLIIRSQLGVADVGDIVIYADAGVEFINNVRYITDRMFPVQSFDIMSDEGQPYTGSKGDIFLFGNQWEHAHWCKGDIARTCWPEPHGYAGEAGSNSSVWGRYGKQVQASVLFFRVSSYTRQFVHEWLKWCLHKVRYSTICTDEWHYLIDDSASHFNNHPEFQENRHDQAILTTMAYREGVKLHWWPAIYNNGAFTYEKLPQYFADDYPALFHHHRKRNHEWK